MTKAIGPQAMITIRVVDRVQRMPATHALPFLLGLSGRPCGEMVLGVRAESLRARLTVEPGPERERWAIEYEGEVWELPGSWVVPWCLGLATARDRSPEDLGAHLTNPGRQQRAQVLMACDQAGWLRSLGIQVG